jgi:hypothetical protein
MSWQATAWAQRQSTGSSGRKALLLILANYADDQGICWPSQETLAKDTEQSVDTVQRQLRKLAELGLIETMKRPQGRGRWPSRTYQLNMLKSTEPQNAARPAEEAPRELNGCESKPQPARDQAATNTVTGPQALRHEPSIEPSFKPSLNPSAATNSKPRLSAAERQQAFQRKRQPIEVIQNRIAARLGDDGWEILQGISDIDLHRLTALQERGRLDETMLEAVRLKRRRGAT